MLGTASRVNDTEASNEMRRIYNDFLEDFCSHYPDREIGLACLPYGNIDDAVAEIRRVAKMGIKGLELSCSWDMDPMWHPVWEPLWNAVEEVQLPLHFHTVPTDTVNLTQISTLFGKIESTLRRSPELFRFRTDAEAIADLVPSIDAAYTAPWPPGTASAN